MWLWKTGHSLRFSVLKNGSAALLIIVRLMTESVCRGCTTLRAQLLRYDDETPIRRHFDKEEYAEPVLLCTLVAYAATD